MRSKPTLPEKETRCVQTAMSGRGDARFRGTVDEGTFGARGMTTRTSQERGCVQKAHWHTAYYYYVLPLDTTPTY
ncbi:hypothetical protein ABVT39_001099 [Epinephelus coioides]